MTLTLADIDRWDPQAVRDVAAAADSRADAAAEAAQFLAALPVFAAWDGVAASAAAGSIALTRADLDEHAAEARAVARAAEEAAEEIATLKAELRDLEDTAHGVLLDHDSGTVRPGAPYRGDGSDAAAVSDRVARIIARADALDARLAQAITLATRLDPAPLTPAVAEPAPGEVARWWAQLPEDDRAALIAADPRRYGNRAGIPAADRDLANRAALNDDLNRVTAAADRAGVAVQQVLADPEGFGLGPDEVTRYANAARTQRGLADAVLRTGVPALLWAYSPEAFGGQGRAAIAINDPDRAQDTAIVVPGTGSSVADGWLGADEAANVFNELSLAEPGGLHSVVAWMGYDAPDSLADPRVVRPALARAGGALLASDVSALAATRTGGPGHLTVIGHSYGSTAVADAAAGSGMRADDVVLVGSPGTDLAATAPDFHLPEGGHVYVGSASTDPVNLVSGVPGVVGLGAGLPAIGPFAAMPGELGLGADPAADGFGSTRFKAEVAEWNVNPVADHGGYFDDGSESLYSIADVASGHGDSLDEHGMTAPHRGAALGGLAAGLGLPTWGVPFTDPELGRTATSWNRH